MVNNHRIARVPYKIPDPPYFSLLPTYFFDDPILTSDYKFILKFASFEDLLENRFVFQA